MISVGWIFIARTGDLCLRHVGRDAVPTHEVLHVFHIFRNVVPIVFARVVHPLGVVLVEFALVIGRKPAR